MACFHPLQAYQTTDGRVIFQEAGKISRDLTLPCGRCTGCRLAHARAWAIRCVHESKMHTHNVFATLTYDEANYTPSLNYRDIQLWLKRLRKHLPRESLRYFVAGEYGDLTGRAHWHALLFGIELKDKKRYSEKYYTSELMSSTWNKGSVMLGDVTYQSAAYCAKYAMTKKTGDMAQAYYQRVNIETGELVQVEPEMAHMSLRPAIGKRWFEKYWKDVYAARDGVVIQNKVLPAPSYYDRLLRQTAPDLADEKEYERYVKSEEFMKDCTPERLAARERVAQAREKLNKRRIG